MPKEKQEDWIKAHWQDINTAAQSLAPGAILFVTKEGDILTPEQKRERAQQPQSKKRAAKKDKSE